MTEERAPYGDTPPTPTPRDWAHVGPFLHALYRACSVQVETDRWGVRVAAQSHYYHLRWNTSGPDLLTACQQLHALIGVSSQQARIEAEQDREYGKLTVLAYLLSDLEGATEATV